MFPPKLRLPSHLPHPPWLSRRRHHHYTHKGNTDRHPRQSVDGIPDEEFPAHLLSPTSSTPLLPSPEHHRVASLQHPSGSPNHCNKTTKHNKHYYFYFYYQRELTLYKYINWGKMNTYSIQPVVRLRIEFIPSDTRAMPVSTLRGHNFGVVNWHTAIKMGTKNIFFQRVFLLSFSYTFRTF